MNLTLNTQISDALAALGQRWEISPAAAARRLLRDGLKAHGLHTRQPLIHRTIRISPNGMKWLQNNRRGRTQSEALRSAINHGLERAATTPPKLIKPDADSHRLSIRVTPGLDAQVNNVADRQQSTWSAAAYSLIYLAASKQE